VWEGGTAATIPTLVLPVGETTEFQLESPDVVHSFGVPGFLMKMDVMPGQDNSFRVTPKETGTFKGKCFELCGVSHSRMLFNVEIVEPEEYEDHLEELAEAGNVSDEPLTGGKYAEEQAGLEGEQEEGQSE
jgi:cytochrome c oxidase subunit 2